MKIQIRRGVFETNSSSTHSITICTEEDFKKFLDGQMVLDRWFESLVPFEKKSSDPDRFITYDEFSSGEWYHGYEYETYSESFTTPDGHPMVAFGSYGRDG